MALDFSEFFKRYEAIIGEADQVFNTVKAKFSENVRCEKGCSDCCHALFDLTLVEALYLNKQFLERFSGKAKSEVLARADEADRLVHRLKRDAFKAAKEGASAQAILAEMAKVRVRCPLLDDAGACQMYDKRPVTCRIYGVPTAIGGQAHTCGKSGFEKGKPYPTVSGPHPGQAVRPLARAVRQPGHPLQGAWRGAGAPVACAYDRVHRGVPGHHGREGRRGGRSVRRRAQGRVCRGGEARASPSARPDGPQGQGCGQGHGGLLRVFARDQEGRLRGLFAHQPDHRPGPGAQEGSGQEGRA